MQGGVAIGIGYLGTGRRMQKTTLNISKLIIFACLGGIVHFYALFFLIFAHWLEWVLIPKA
jgi:hypothetical protein